MEDPLDLALLTLRRTQLGAAIAAVGVPDAAFSALIDTFPAAIVTICSVESSAGFPALRIGTFAAGPDAIERLRGLIVNGLGGHPKQAGLVEAVLGELAASAFRVEVEVNKAGAAGLRVVIPTDSDPLRALDVLARCRVSPEVLDAFSTRLMGTSSRRVTGFVIDFPQISGPPRFWLDLALTITPAERPRLFEVQARVLGQIGASQAQVGWHRGLAEFCTPRPANQVGVRLGLGFDALIDEAWFSYPVVPVKLVLKLLSQFAPSEHTGTRIAALSVAAGVADDAVQALHLGAWSGEPPKIAFEWRSPGIPGALDV